jgi:hypothetical protein
MNVDTIEHWIDCLRDFLAKLELEEETFLSYVKLTKQSTFSRVNVWFGVKT